MNKRKILHLLLCLPLGVLATENDSLKVKDLQASARPIATSISTSETPNLVGDVEATRYSFEIVEFDSNQIPLTEAQYLEQVGTLEFEVPMDYNRYVKRQINYFGTRWQEKLKTVVSRSEYYFPIYEEILDQHNMPLELKYLSIIESGLNPFARSRSGAVGPWQFMPATGRIFHLDNNYKIDERRSIEKSTNAACEYLKQMYAMFGDWHVALASYNCGPGNVRKAIRRSGRKDFWGMYHYLPRETQNYVPKFIAMAYIMNFYDTYGITPAPINDYQYCVEQVYCKEGIEFSVVAEQLGMTSKDLLLFNPELKIAHIPFENGGYMLTVPADKAMLYYNNQSEIISLSVIAAEERKREEALRPKVVYHTVKKGECLPIIARKHGCTVSQLKSWNGIRGSLIYPNQKIKIIKS